MMRMSRRGSMLPPLSVTTTGPGDDANRCGCWIRAAQATLPAGSTTTLLRVINRRIAWHMESSDTVRTSSTHFDWLMTPNVTAPGMPTLMPSAMELISLS